MTEPSTHVPGEVADAHVDETATDGTTTDAAETGSPTSTSATEEKVELDLDEDKLEAWDAIKSDYQVDPDAEDVPAGTDEDGMPEGNAPG